LRHLFPLEENADFECPCDPCLTVARRVAFFLIPWFNQFPFFMWVPKFPFVDPPPLCGPPFLSPFFSIEFDQLSHEFSLFFFLFLSSTGFVVPTIPLFRHPPLLRLLVASSKTNPHNSKRAGDTRFPFFFSAFSEQKMDNSLHHSPWFPIALFFSACFFSPFLLTLNNPPQTFFSSRDSFMVLLHKNFFRQSFCKRPGPSYPAIRPLSLLCVFFSPFVSAFFQKAFFACAGHHSSPSQFCAASFPACSDFPCF